MQHMEITLDVVDNELTIRHVHCVGEKLQDQVSLKVLDDLLGTTYAEDSNYFACLQKVRLAYEKHGSFLMCQGARPNVYPSRMSMSMGKGQKAYVLQLGKQASGELVNIFDPAEVSEVSTVDEQLDFYTKWIESL